MAASRAYARAVVERYALGRPIAEVSPQFDTNQAARAIVEDMLRNSGIGGANALTVQDTVALGSVPKRFLRVSIVQALAELFAAELRA